MEAGIDHWGDKRVAVAGKARKTVVSVQES